VQRGLAGFQVKTVSDSVRLQLQDLSLRSSAVRPREEATKRIFAGVIPISRRGVRQEHSFFIETRTNVTVERISENMRYVHNNRSDVRERWMQGGFISDSKAPVRFSRCFVNFHRGLPMVSPSLFATSRRLFSSQSAEHHSRKIYHPCIDGFFKHGFESDIALKGFLNSILDLKDGSAIEDIEQTSKDMPSAVPNSGAYHFTVDVMCKTKDGRHFLVEMQNDFRDDYHMKALLEHSRMLSRIDVKQIADEQNEKPVKSSREFWKGIKGVYAIVLTNKAFDEHRMKRFYQEEPLMEPNLVNTYELRHVNQLTRHYGDTPHQLVLLMLANLRTDHLSKLFSPIEKWAYVFKDTRMKRGTAKLSPVKKIEDSDIIEEDPAIKAFVERLDVEKIPLEVRDKYVGAINYYNDTIVDIAEKAREEGVKEGEVTGLKEGLLRWARALKVMGTMTNAQITDQLGGDLTEAEVAAIKID